MSSTISKPLLAFANLLIPIAILVFATGFFPYKPFIPGKATFGNLDHGRPREAAPFDKVIFMVVDALRRWELPENQALRWSLQYQRFRVRSQFWVPTHSEVLSLSLRLKHMANSLP